MQFVQQTFTQYILTALAKDTFSKKQNNLICISIPMYVQSRHCEDFNFSVELHRMCDVYIYERLYTYRRKNNVIILKRITQYARKVKEQHQRIVQNQQFIKQKAHLFFMQWVLFLQSLRKSNVINLFANIKHQMDFIILGRQDNYNSHNLKSGMYLI